MWVILPHGMAATRQWGHVSHGRGAVRRAVRAAAGRLRRQLRRARRARRRGVRHDRRPRRGGPVGRLGRPGLRPALAAGHAGQRVLGGQGPATRGVRGPAGRAGTPVGSGARAWLSRQHVRLHDRRGDPAGHRRHGGNLAAARGRRPARRRRARRPARRRARPGRVVCLARRAACGGGAGRARPRAADGAQRVLQPFRPVRLRGDQLAGVAGRRTPAPVPSWMRRTHVCEPRCRSGAGLVS